MSKLDEVKLEEERLLTEIRKLNSEKRKLIVRTKDRILYLRKLEKEKDKEIKKFHKNKENELKKIYKDTYKKELTKIKAEALIKAQKDAKLITKEYKEKEREKVIANIENEKIRLKSKMKDELKKYKTSKKKQIKQSLYKNIESTRIRRYKKLDEEIKKRRKEKLKKLNNKIKAKIKEREIADKLTHKDNMIPITLQYPIKPTNMKQVMIQVSSDLHKDYKNFCEVNNFVMSERIRTYMVHDINTWKLLINTKIKEKKAAYDEKVKEMKLRRQKKLEQENKQENNENDDLDN
ncbi:MAG: hypothetical protein M0R46_10345 [Candidatus Muirbacterium halophilum]|nr:hypothetical protein [Candidatus Muirbacterium halophilum]